MKKVLVLLSGGIDSSTCLAMACQQFPADEILAANCYYGQKNAREMEAAKQIADHYGVELIRLDLADIFEFSDCPMLARSGNDIEQKSYQEQTQAAGGKPISSYVPFRNGIMLSALVGIAYSIGAGEIWYGAHADDAEGNAYPDCSLGFIKAMNKAALHGTGGAVGIVAPLGSIRKKDIVAEGLRLGVPYELTWSCYESGEHPCGKCGTCLAIKEAFAANGAEYPVK